MADSGNERGTRGNSRDDVAQAALRILDDLGLPDLTMRRLAAALDVQPSALYWHFPNKQSLLAELSDRILSRAEPVPASGAWTQRVRGEASALRDALLAYRDGAEVVMSTLALGLGSPRTHERLAAAAAAGGFDEPTARRAAGVLLHFVLGHVSHEQQRMQYDSLGVRESGRADAGGGADDPGAEFDFGIELFVRGLDRVRISVN